MFPVSNGYDMTYAHYRNILYDVSPMREGTYYIIVFRLYYGYMTLLGNELLYKIDPLWEAIVRSKCFTYVVYEFMSPARK